MKLIHFIASVGFCIILLVAEVNFAQKKNPTVYPYGGVPDKSRMEEWMKRSPVNFNRSADFRDATFNDWADFRGANFHREAKFARAYFDDWADFHGDKFYSEAEFGGATFDAVAYFLRATFDDFA